MEPDDGLRSRLLMTLRATVAAIAGTINTMIAMAAMTASRANNDGGTGDWRLVTTCASARYQDCCSTCRSARSRLVNR